MPGAMWRHDLRDPVLPGKVGAGYPPALCSSFPKAWPRNQSEQVSSRLPRVAAFGVWTYLLYTLLPKPPSLFASCLCPMLSIHSGVFCRHWCWFVWSFLLSYCSGLVLCASPILVLIETRSAMRENPALNSCWIVLELWVFISSSSQPHSPPEMRNTNSCPAILGVVPFPSKTSQKLR